MFVTFGQGWRHVRIVCLCCCCGGGSVGVGDSKVCRVGMRESGVSVRGTSFGLGGECHGGGRTVPGRVRRECRVPRRRHSCGDQIRNGCVRGVVKGQRRL